MSKFINVNNDSQRRSSVSSSCPSSSFSSSTEYSDSMATPSPSSWHPYADSYYPTMKDITTQAFLFPDLSSADAMDSFLSMPFPNQPCSDFVANPFADSIDPIRTVNQTNPSPSISEASAYAFTFDGLKQDFGDVKSDYEDAKQAYFLPEAFSPVAKSEDNDFKLEAQYEDQYQSPIKKGKKRKFPPDYPLTVATGKFKCNFPGCATTKRFVRAEHLKRHERTHDTTGKYSVTCQFCGKPFSRADNLRDHEKRHRNDSGSTAKSKRVRFIPHAAKIIEEQQNMKKKLAGHAKNKSRVF